MHFRRCTVLIQATPYALAWGSPCMPGCWMQWPARCPRRRGHDEQYARRNISNPNHLRLDGWAGSALAGERAGDSDGALCPRIFHRRSRCRCAIVAATSSAPGSSRVLGKGSAPRSMDRARQVSTKHDQKYNKKRRHVDGVGCYWGYRWWSRRESNPRPQALYRQFYILSPVFSSFKLHHARRTGWISPSRLGFCTCPSDPDKHDFM